MVRVTIQDSKHHQRRRSDHHQHPSGKHSQQDADFDPHAHRNSKYHHTDPLLDRMGLRSWKDECHPEDILLKYPIPIPQTGMMRVQKKRSNSAPGLGRTISLVEALQRPKATRDLVKKLLTMKASVRERASKNDKTPLHIAVRTNNVDACHVILDAAVLLQPSSRFKEVLEAQDLLGLTPLMEAASAGYLDVVEELLKRGALVTATSSIGSTVLDCAYQSGHVEVIDMIEKHAQHQKELEHAQKKQSSDQWTSLMHAAQKGDKMSIERAVASGNKPWESGFMNDTPLHVAARHGKVPAVQALLQAKAFVNRKNDAQLTALSCAVAAGHIPVIRILLEAKADIRKEDHELVVSKSIKEESKGLEIAEALRPAHMLRSGRGDKKRHAMMTDARASILEHLTPHEKDAALVELENFENFLSNKLTQSDVVAKRQNNRASVRFSIIHSTLTRAFKNFNDTKNAEITKTEFMKGMASLGYKGETAKLFGILDIDKNGTISVPEIVEAAEKLALSDNISGASSFPTSLLRGPSN